MTIRKYILLILLPVLFTPGLMSAQNATGCKGAIKQPPTTVLAYIKNNDGKDTLNHTFFHNSFSIALSDTSYRVKSFFIIWSDGESIRERVNEGAVVNPDYTDQDGKLQPRLSFKLARPGDFITFEGIIIEKNNVCYSAKQLAVHLK